MPPLHHQQLPRAEDVIRLFTMAHHAHTGRDDARLRPLFETVEDLAGRRTRCAPCLRRKRRNHLAGRGDVQHVMLGFSDGTKDGIPAGQLVHPQAKERLSAVCREAGVEVVFFDGRGGPPAAVAATRTASMQSGPGRRHPGGSDHHSGAVHQFQLRNPRSASYNLGSFVAGIQHRLIDPEKSRWTEGQRALMNQLAERSYAEYGLKAPVFMEYLTYGTLKHYGATNIASRPTSRKKDGPLTLDDLGPFHLWGLESVEAECARVLRHWHGTGRVGQGGRREAAELYRTQPLFAALLENSMQSMRKCNFA